MSKEMSKGRVGHTQGVTATIANRKINTMLLLLLLSLWKNVQYYRGNINTVLAKRAGRELTCTKEARDVFCTGKAQMAFLQHTQPRINKAKLQRDKQHDSPRAPSVKHLLQVKTFRLNIPHLSPLENRWCPAKSEL